MGMTINENEEAQWTVPKIGKLIDFELCRAVKERGRPTGNYEVLEGNALVRNALVNWEAVFVQFRDSNGESVSLWIPTCLHGFCVNNQHGPLPYQYRHAFHSFDAAGELLPIRVSLPSILDEEDEEAELAAARKGKRKAPPEAQ